MRPFAVAGLGTTEIRNKNMGGIPHGCQNTVEVRKAGFILARGLFSAGTRGVDRRRNPPLFVAGHQGAAVREAESQRSAHAASGKLLACPAYRKKGARRSNRPALRSA